MVDYSLRRNIRKWWIMKEKKYAKIIEYIYFAALVSFFAVITFVLFYNQAVNGIVYHESGFTIDRFHSDMYAYMQEMQGLEDELEKLKDSLETRKMVDRAKGIIMAAHKLGEQEAYRRMQQYAMQKRVPLKDVAQSIIRAAGGKA